MRYATLLVALVSLPVLAAQTAPRVLTLEEALQNAREHQPQLLEAHASSQAALARADEAKAPLLPQVAGSASYQRATENLAAGLGSTVSGATPGSSSWTTAGRTSLGLSASQLLWDFGASSSHWRSAQATASSQEESERATTLDSLATVRQLFFQARAARGLVSVAADTLANVERHLEQVQAFVEVGTNPEIDLAQTRAERANARVQLITAQNAYETAKAQLNQAMGVEDTTEYDVADETFPPLDGEDQDTDTLLAEALAARPEVAAIAGSVRAQELSVRAVRGDLWPSLVASTGFTDVGGNFSDLTWNWSAAVGLFVPLFQGGVTKAQVREAEWNLQGLQAQASALRQQVRFDVEQARLAVKAAKATLEASQEVLTNADEQLRLAEGRYETGVGSIIELGDAQVARTSAAQQKVAAEYSLATARAQLQRALGRV